MTRLQPLTLLLLEAVGCPPHPHTPPLSLCNQRQPQTDTGLPAPPPEYPQVYKCVCVCVCKIEMSDWKLFDVNLTLMTTVNSS